MKTYRAKRLHENPSEVYSRAHREPVVIQHRHHGEMLLISRQQILTRHRQVDGTVVLHIRSLSPFPDEIAAV